MTTENDPKLHDDIDVAADEIISSIMNGESHGPAEETPASEKVVSSVDAPELQVSDRDSEPELDEAIMFSASIEGEQSESVFVEDTEAMESHSGVMAAPVPTKKRNRLALIVGLAVVVVLASLIGADYALSYNRIHPGVSVAGVDVGGLKVPDAAAAIETGLTKSIDETISVTAAGKTWEATPASLGVSYDATALAEAAYDVGKTDRVVIDRLEAWFGGIDLHVDLEFDPAVLDAYLTPIESEVAIPPVQSAVKIDGTDFTVIPGTDGTRVDDKAFVSSLNEAFLGPDDSVELALVTAPMDITPEIAEKGIEQATKIVSAPVTLTHEAKSWEFAPESIASWLTFDATETADGWGLLPRIDAEAAAKTITEKLGAEIGAPAKNAEFYVSGDSIAIRPSEQGTGVDTVALVEEMNRALSTGVSADRTIALKVTVTEPEITTAAAEAMGIKDKLATYTTSYSTGAANRNTNIHRMAELLSGSLVAPGGTWSFHQTGGPTTLAKGFKPAGAIVNGVVVDELGGGICQVATTVFNAVFESGFPVVERSPHSRYLSNYPAGRDAAVSWTVPDLKWKNDSANYVLMTTSYTNSTVTVTLWGTATGYKVTSETGAWSILSSGGTQEILNPALPAGTRKTKQAAAPGRSIIVKRTVTKDGAVVRVDTFKSTYKAVDQIVEVGTGAAVVPSTETTP